MIRRPPRSTRSDTLFPYTTLFRSTRDFGPPALAAKHCCQGCRNLLVGVLWQRKVGAMVPHTPCFPRAELPQRRSRWPHYGRRRGMPLWAIEAIAVSEDSRWQDFPIWAEVVVRAPTPAQARLVAAAMEGGQIADPTTVGNETLAFRSGFQDEKLYQVRQVHLTGTSDDGPDEVLSARQARPASRP